MAIKSEKLNFESTTGEMLAARLDLPAAQAGDNSTRQSPDRGLISNRLCESQRSR